MSFVNICRCISKFHWLDLCSIQWVKFANTVFSADSGGCLATFLNFFSWTRFAYVFHNWIKFCIYVWPLMPNMSSVWNEQVATCCNWTWQWTLQQSYGRLLNTRKWLFAVWSGKIVIIRKSYIVFYLFARALCCLWVFKWHIWIQLCLISMCQTYSNQKACFEHVKDRVVVEARKFDFGL